MEAARAQPVSWSPVAWSAFATGYLGAYFLSTSGKWPLLLYSPLERRFGFDLTGVVVDFYGRLLVCAAVGAVAAVPALLARRRLTEAGRRTWLFRLLVWNLGLVLLTAALEVYLLHDRRLEGIELPSWYVPR